MIRIRTVVDPTHRRFEDRPMGVFRGSYRFVQWRPDGDSFPKPRHFMWVFALVSFSLFTVLSCVLYVSCIITCDRLLYFISLITCITSCDIRDRTSYLFSWIERLLSFHVLVVVTVDLGLVLDTLYCDLIWSSDQLTYVIFEVRGHILGIVFIGSCWWLSRLEFLWIARKC